MLDERESDEGRLTVAALDALWRRERGGQSLLPFTELLAVLVRLGSPRLISGFRIRLLSTLEDDELAKLLVAVAPRTRNELMFGTHEVVHEILSRGLDAFWIERLLDVVLGDDPTAGAVVRQDIEHEVTAIAQREELAQHVLLNATVRDPKQQRRARWVLSRWVHSVSLPWLLARCSDREQDALWCGWACDRFGAIVNSGDVARMSEALELMGEARERVLLLRESTRLWFEGMSVDDVSESDRDLARGEEQLRRDQAARADARDQQRSRWLERVGEPEAFWRLVVSAVRGEDVERALRGDNIASGAWWVALTPAQQTAVLDGAERYLNTGGPHEETWYLQSRLDYRALAGRLAMELLLASGRRLDPAICERWSYVLFEEWGGVDRGSLRDQLIQWAAHVAPRAVNERAIELTEHAIEQGQWVFVTRVYAGIRLDQLLDALPKLMAKVTTPSSVPDLFGYWLRWRPELAAQFAEGTLRDVTPQTALHVGLSAALIANPSDRLWSIAADAFARASSLLDAVLAAELPLESSRSDREAFESVSTRLLARMWSVWANSRAAQQPEGVIELVASGRLLFDRMLTVLFDRASRSAEDLAVFEQLASSPHAPEWMASRVEDARLELRARSWTARPLDTLRAAMRPVAAGVAGALHGASVVIRSATADVGASMKRLFTWVHLSDIHFGHGARDALVEFDQAEVTAKLPKHIHKELKRTGLSIDAVLVTGDVAFSGQAKEYQQAHEWFDLLCTSAGIAKERVFVVPGNHDVNAVGDDFATGALVEQLRKSEPESRTVGSSVGRIRARC
ncbi:MAG: metallophosphoesterase [Polyangiales bacterium]